VFVDTEVGQMDIPLFDFLEFVAVFMCGEPHESLFKYVYAKRVVAGHQHVYPQIIFQIIDEMGISDVLRY
jgi:hypothetical protein